MFFKRSQFRVSFEIQAVTIQAFVSWIFQFTCGSVFQFFFVFFFCNLKYEFDSEKAENFIVRVTTGNNLRPILPPF